MPLIGLYVKADLEGVAEVVVPEDHEWIMDVDDGCGGPVRRNVSFNKTEFNEIPNSRGSANFVVKFEGGVCTLSVVDLKGIRCNEYLADDSGSDKLLALLECRGVQPVKWHPTGGYRVVCNSGTIFDAVDLHEDWVEYDEKAKESVGVYNLQHDFKTYKKQ
eukprot:Platyproteum_vivax@DN3042_c0_g1_i1.p1